METLKEISLDAVANGYGAKYHTQQWVREEFKYDFVPLGQKRPPEKMEDREWLEITDPGELSASLFFVSNDGKCHAALWDAYKQPAALAKRVAERAAAKKEAYAGAGHGDGYRGRMTTWGRY